MSSADKKAIYTALLMLAQRTKASYETAVQALDGRKYRIPLISGYKSDAVLAQKALDIARREFADDI